MIRDKKLINFSKLFFGSSLGQVLALALYPSIAHFYSPADFSRFGFIFSLTSILSVFATGQFHAAIMNPKDDREADDLIGLATCCVSAFSLLTLVVLYFVDPSLVIVGVYLFFFSLFEVERLYLVRKQAYSASAITQFIFRLLGNGGKLFPFFVHLNYLGLVVSEICALVIVVSYGFFKGLFNFRFHWNLVKKYRSFPIFHSFTMAINYMILDFPILFWTMKYAPSEIGYFVMGQKLLLVPALVASQALQSATVHQLLASKNPAKNLLKTLLLMVMIGVCGILFFFFLGNDFVKLLLGDQWINGHEVFKILSFLFVTRLIYAHGQAIFVLKGATKKLFPARVLQLGALLILTKMKLDFYQSLWVYVGIEFVAEFSLFLWATWMIRPPFVFRKETV